MFHLRESPGAGLRHARHNNSASTAYSAACALLRVPKIRLSMVCGEADGNSHVKNGLRNRDVWLADMALVDAVKMTAIHSSTGSQ